MYIVKVLKRKDGAALIVGVVVALIVSNLLTSTTADWSNRIADTNSTGPGWHQAYLFPIVFALLQLIAFEILIRIYVAIHNSMSG